MRAHSLRLFWLSFVLYTLAGSIAAQSEQRTSNAWYNLNAQNDGFSARFPGKPKFESEPMLGGVITLNTYSYNVGQDFAFTVAFFDLQGSKAEDSQNVLDTMAKYAFTSMKGSVTATQDIDEGGCSGREYRGTTPSNGIVRMHLFKSGQRSFMVLFIAAATAKNVKAVSDYFFSSFAVSDGCKGGFAPVEAPSDETTKESLEGVTDPATGWRRVSIAKHEFEILVPNRTEVESGQTQVQPFPMSESIYSSDDGSTSYIVIVDGDYPSGLVTKTNQSNSLEVLDRKFRDLMAKYGMIVTLKRNLAVAGFPGREYDLVSSIKIGRAEIFVTNKRSYFFITASDKGKFNYVYANRFFASIKISVK